MQLNATEMRADFPSGMPGSVNCSITACGMWPGKSQRVPGFGGTTQNECFSSAASPATAVVEDVAAAGPSAPRMPPISPSCRWPARKTRQPPVGCGKPGGLGSPSSTKYTPLHLPAVCACSALLSDTRLTFSHASAACRSDVATLATYAHGCSCSRPSSSSAVLIMP